MLLQAGANPNVKSAIHWPMRFGNGYYPDGVEITPLFLAILNNQFPMVQLLLKFKADPDDAQMDRRAVIFSALNYPEILTALLDAGAKVDVRDETDAGNVSGSSTFQSRLNSIIMESEIWEPVLNKLRCWWRLKVKPMRRHGSVAEARRESECV